MTGPVDTGRRSTGRRSTERLLADAQERLELAADLPARVGRVRGWAVDEAADVRITVDVHGALCGLELTEAALRLGPEHLGHQIVLLSRMAAEAALAEAVAVLAPALGDGASEELARDVGLGHLIGADPEVVPYVPGVDPNARCYVRSPPVAPSRTAGRPVVPSVEPSTAPKGGEHPAPPEDEDPHSFDFSSLRSDH